MRPVQATLGIRPTVRWSEWAALEQPEQPVPPGTGIGSGPAVARSWLLVTQRPAMLMAASRSGQGGHLDRPIRSPVAKW